MKKFTRFLSFCCVLTLLMGLCPLTLATGQNPTSEGGVLPYSDTNHPYDVSVMTFNILADNSGTAKYDTPANRLDRIIGLIEQYGPDAVNIQEAASTYYVDSAKTLSWHDALVQRLTAIGYGYVSFKSITNANQSIQRGLLIFFKEDRFSFDSAKQQSGWGDLTTSATYNGVTARHPYDRAYIYAEVLDKQHGNMPVWFFNTHFAIDVSTDTAGVAISDTTTRDKISADIRTQQSKEFATDIKALAGDAPFFASGDYNIGLNASYSDAYYTKPVDAQYRQLVAMTDTFPAMKPAALVAKRTLNTDIYGQNTGKVWTGIDHIYINDNLQVVTDYRTLADHVDGRRPSDHLPRIAYCSYRPAITASAGSYDKWTGEFEHTVSANSLSLTLTPANSNITYALGDNAVGNNTVTLSGYKNTFDIKLYNKGALYDTIPATVINTAATKPTLTASGATNVYFAKGAYHIVTNQSTTSVTPTVSGGALYAEAGCYTKVTTLTADKARKTYYVKATAGEVFPVYLYHETAAADANSKVVYVEDDTAGATGTVAFYDGENTILGAAGSKIYSDFPNLRTPIRNGAITTVIFAGGDYNGFTPADNDLALNKGVTLLGNNANIDANDRSGAGWTVNPNRKEETVIHGSFRIYQSAGTSYTYNITIKGFTFADQGNYGSIHVEDSSAKATVLDIQNNIFTGSGYHWTSAPLWMNNYSPKSGVIKNNAFIPEGNQVVDENASWSNSFYNRRGIFARNINGLAIEGNRFVGFNAPLMLFSETSGNTAGYASFTIKDNSFELCDHLELSVKNVTSATASAIDISGNHFLRCGNETGCGNAKGLNAVYLQYTEAGAGIDFSKCSLRIADNNFEECHKSLYISRSGSTTAAAVMPITITGNRFVPNDQHNQTDYLKETLELNFSLGGENPTNWDLSHNYFSSAYLLQGNTQTQTNNNLVVPDVNDPALFINTYDLYTLDRSIFTPYYTDYDMTVLGQGVTQEPTAATLADIDTDLKWLGRTYSQNGYRYFNWTNSGFEVNFKGTDLFALLRSSAPGGTDTPYVKVYVDGKYDRTIALHTSMEYVALATDLTDSAHTVRVVKRSNGRSSTAALEKLWVNNGGAFLAPDKSAGRKMQLVGDSITVGYGANNPNGDTAWSTATEDGTLTYAALAAEYFGADNHTVAVSGRGLVLNNGGGTDDLASALYEYTDWNNKAQWDHASWQPDVIVLNYGANDQSAGVADETFKTACKAFITQVRNSNPDAQIIYAYGFMGVQYVEEVEAVVNELRAAGDNKVHYLYLPPVTSAETSMDHPTATAHEERAQLLIAKVAEVTGWDAHTQCTYEHAVASMPTTVAGVMGYTCPVCGSYYEEAISADTVAWNEERILPYTSLEEALAEAQSGETVALYADTVAGNVTVNPGVTLDLAGHSLKADYLVGLATSRLVNSAENADGKLILPADHLALAKDNPYLPVYDATEGCYLFTRVKNDRFELTTDDITGCPKYSTSPMFKEYAHGLLSTEAKAADSGMQVIIRLHWTDAEGQYAGTQDYTYFDHSVAEYAGSYTNENGSVNYGKSFYGIFTGSEIAAGVSVSVSTVIKTDAGVEMISAVTPIV